MAQLYKMTFHNLKYRFYNSRRAKDMSRLSEILGVEERQEFSFENTELFVKRDRVFFKNSDELWTELCSARFLCDLIAHSESIKTIPPKPKLTEQQITAIKGRIAEGWNWVATDSSNLWVVCFTEKPVKDDYTFYSSNREEDSLANKDIFDFVTYENSPIYLPDLISEND